MKVLTVKQPWASLIVEGIKDIENRTWKTNYRGRILIHASGRKLKGIMGDYLSEKQIEFLYCGGTRLKKVYDFECGKQTYSAIIGSVEIIDCVINHPSIWAEKTFYDGFEDDKPIYNWVLANPIKFEKPIPCKGALSLWDYKGELPL